MSPRRPRPPPPHPHPTPQDLDTDANSQAALYVTRYGQSDYGGLGHADRHWYLKALCHDISRNCFVMSSLVKEFN